MIRISTGSDRTVRGALRACLLTLLTLGAGCAATSTPVWVAEEFEVGSGRVLWEYTLLAIDKAGFPLGSGIDPTTFAVTTGWQTHLSPFKDEGYRQRAEVRLVPVEAGRYRVEARVERESNAALVRPTDPRYADWTAQPDDELTANVLVQHIAAYVRPSLGFERD